MNSKIKRHNIFIKKSFQLKIAFIAFFSILIIAIMVGIDVYFTINNTMLEMFKLEPEFVTAIKSINNILFLKIIIYLIIVFSISFFISHKIAGPIFRFEKTCEKVLDGDLTTRVNLRKLDALKDLQIKYNLMIDSIQIKLKKIDMLCNELELSNQPEELYKVREEIKKNFKLS